MYAIVKESYGGQIIVEDESAFGFEPTDYLVEALNDHYNALKEMNDAIFSSVVNESVQLLNMSSDLMITLEADGDTASVKKKGIIRRVIDFIKRILGMFKDKINQVGKTNEAWLARNEKALSEVNYSGLAISMIPYWRFDINTGLTKLKSDVERAKNQNTINNLTKENADAQKVNTTLFNSYLLEGNLVDGAKNYFRVGKVDNNSLRPETLESANLKSTIESSIIPYCKDYSKGIVNNLTAIINSAVQWLQQLEKQTAPTATTENFVFAEGDIVLEAEGDATTTATQSDQKPAPTKVEVTDKGENGSSTTTTTTKPSDSIAVQSLIATSIQQLAAAAMTAAEERYTAYNKAIKEVIKARKPASN